MRKVVAVRIIPAWAGNTERNPEYRRMDADHPRVGGEHVFCAYAPAAANG